MEGRLLSRLGVTVSTVMPMTQRVVSVPDTEPGGTCTVDIPGRPAHLIGVTEVHYIMTFGDLRPCFPDDRRTIRLLLTTTTTIGAQETLPIPSSSWHKPLAAGSGACERQRTPSFPVGSGRR